jgi:hypothetical protein
MGTIKYTNVRKIVKDQSHAVTHAKLYVINAKIDVLIALKK